VTGTACGEGNAYPSGAPDFTSGFHRGSCCPVICEKAVLCYLFLYITVTRLFMLLLIYIYMCVCVCVCVYV